ncbi:hypothetical protein DFP72DRAFT_847304 [Ephemerocybe angulata]|uniref:Uncharacterized protein n=1 Tax=Ephemerocybe angulata TaxID=980116 RepID=A0A8H6M832_9AGAR|nr:hypothetical protein DFP72DRAFT_847304 [Tulosesus angulatus]
MCTKMSAGRRPQHQIIPHRHRKERPPDLYIRRTSNSGVPWMQSRCTLSINKGFVCVYEKAQKLEVLIFMGTETVENRVYEKPKKGLFWIGLFAAYRGVLLCVLLGVGQNESARRAGVVPATDRASSSPTASTAARRHRPMLAALRWLGIVQGVLEEDYSAPMSDDDDPLDDYLRLVYPSSSRLSHQAIATFTDPAHKSSSNACTFTALRTDSPGSPLDSTRRAEARTLELRLVLSNSLAMEIAARISKSEDRRARQGDVPE